MRPHHNIMETGSSVLLYSFCSVSMILVNKLVMNTYDMNYPFAILMLQTGGALALVAMAKLAGFVEYPSFSIDVAKKWLPLTLLFVTMLFTSMKSLGTMSVATQTILKNLAVVCTAIGDKILYGKAQTSSVYGSFALMIFGSYLGANGDQWVTSWGLFWTFLNIISTFSYTLYMKAVLGAVSGSIGRYGPVFYNNLLCLPFFFIMGINEIAPFSTAVEESSAMGKVILIFSILVSSVMTFSVFWCMSITSPTTMSVVGSLNKVPLTFLGIFIFNQYPNTTGYFGIFIALSAGFLYTYLNIRANRAKAAADAEQLRNAAARAPEAPVLVQSEENPLDDTSKEE